MPTRKQLRRVLDNLFAFVGLLERDGTVIETDRAPLQVAGITAEDVPGKKFRDCYWWSYSLESQARLREAVSHAISGKMLRYDVSIRAAGDARLRIDFQLAPRDGI